MATPALQLDLHEEAAMTPKQVSIVEAAAKLFLERGFGSVSMDAIAAEAEVSKRTVYSYYENKESLFGDIMHMLCEQQGGRENCPLSSEDLITNELPCDILQKTGEHVLRIITSPQGIEMIRVVISESGRFPELGKSFFEMGPGWVINQLALYLDILVESGQLEAADTTVEARKFLGMVTFPLNMEMLLGLKPTLSPQEITEIAKNAVDTFAAAHGLTQ